jgi:hypothetical protein
MPSGPGSLEGDGWVNWSGLATDLAGLASKVVGACHRLLLDNLHR